MMESQIVWVYNRLRVVEILSFNKDDISMFSNNLTFSGPIKSIDILYTLDSPSNYSAIQKLKP